MAPWIIRRISYSRSAFRFIDDAPPWIIILLNACVARYVGGLTNLKHRGLVRSNSAVRLGVLIMKTPSIPLFKHHHLPLPTPPWRSFLPFFSFAAPHSHLYEFPEIRCAGGESFICSRRQRCNLQHVLLRGSKHGTWGSRGVLFVYHEGV